MTKDDTNDKSNSNLHGTSGEVKSGRGKTTQGGIRSDNPARLHGGRGSMPAGQYVERLRTSATGDSGQSHGELSDGYGIVQTPNSLASDGNAAANRKSNIRSNETEMIQDEEESYSLMESTKLLGQLLPVLKDAHGNIIDGFHRKGEDPNWKESTVSSIETPLQLAYARLVVNDDRRKVSREEKTKRLTQIYEETKTQFGEYPRAEDVATNLGHPPPNGKSWVYKYLDEKYKGEQGPKGPRQEIVRRTISSVQTPPEKSSDTELIEPPPETTNADQLPSTFDIPDTSSTQSTSTTPAASDVIVTPLEEHRIVFKDGKIFHGGGELLSESFETIGAAKIYVTIEPRPETIQPDTAHPVLEMTKEMKDALKNESEKVPKSDKKDKDLEAWYLRWKAQGTNSYRFTNYCVNVSKMTEQEAEAWLATRRAKK